MHQVEIKRLRPFKPRNVAAHNLHQLPITTFTLGPWKSEADEVYETLEKYKTAVPRKITREDYQDQNYASL